MNGDFLNVQLMIYVTKEKSQAQLKKEENVSLMDMSCFPFSPGLFDLDKIYFTKCPTKLFSADGIKTRIKLFSGALVLNYATVDRLIIDMDANHIGKAVVQQINPPKKSCAKVMDNIVKNNDRLYTFASIHPFDANIPAKIDNYMKMDIKGWKLNPHIWGVPIDCDESIALLKELAKTRLPMMQIAYDALLRDNKDLNILCPVLITYGEYDKTGKVRYYCKLWHEQTNYPLQIIKNAGHNANVDNPKEMNRIIKKFFEENGL